jgi:HK97 family phage prohead protease
MEQQNNRKIIFTSDAKLSLKKFTAVAKGPDSEQVPEKIATLSGYAIVWNEVSGDRGGYKVRMLPGSAKIATPCNAFWSHDPSQPIGTTANGSLRITSDDIGVKVEIDLPDTTTGRDAEELVENKYVTGMSFAMADAPDQTTVKEGGETVVNVKSVLVDEVSITAIPAFSGTSIAVTEDDEPEDEVQAAPDTLSAKPANVEVMKERTRQRLNIEKLNLSMMSLD